MNRVFVVIRELPYKRASLCNCSVLKGEVVNQEPAIRRTLNGKLEPKVRYSRKCTLIDPRSPKVCPLDENVNRLGILIRRMELDHIPYTNKVAAFIVRKSPGNYYWIESHPCVPRVCPWRCSFFVR